LNSSLQWHQKEITIPAYYAIYFSIRFEHLDIFDNWLNRF
jgi:hypothetical protein